MGKDNLKVIATELVTRVRKSVTIDWTLRESGQQSLNPVIPSRTRHYGRVETEFSGEIDRLVAPQRRVNAGEVVEIDSDIVKSSF
jgi:hypothetical protein